MKLSSSNIKEILIFSQKKDFLLFSRKAASLIFPKMKPWTFRPQTSKRFPKKTRSEKISYIFLYFPKWNPALFSLNLRNKKNPPRQNFLYFKKQKPRKVFLYFRKRNFLIF